MHKLVVEYGYDIWGQQTRYAADGAETTYAYDALGQRIQKTTNGATTTGGPQKRCFWGKGEAAKRTK